MSDNKNHTSFQTLFVILLSSQDMINTILDITHHYLPHVHDKLQNVVQRQTKILRREKGEDAPEISPVCSKTSGLIIFKYIHLIFIKLYFSG
jgi:hypothetical protein